MYYYAHLLTLTYNPGGGSGGGGGGDGDDTSKQNDPPVVTQKLDLTPQQDFKILSDFQSSVQQCVVRNFLLGSVLCLFFFFFPHYYYIYI